VLFLAVAYVSTVRATVPDPAEAPIKQFLAQDDAQPAYRAVRRLEAVSGSRTGWMEAITEYSRSTGFRYEVTGEGGSALIRSRVLRALLEGEQDVIARNETARSSLDPSNYRFTPNGIDRDGLANVLLSPATAGSRNETRRVPGG